jgi:chromate reductase
MEATTKSLTKKKILAINGSASSASANQKLVEQFAILCKNDLDVVVYNDLKALPHFDPELSVSNTPKMILDLREQIQNAAGVLISSPEYVFSIPSGLKNLIEWCVSTTVFSDKPLGIITASADGKKAHEELQLIMKTVMAQFTSETTLLINGIKGKLNENGQITDAKTKEDLQKFAKAFIDLAILQ